MALVTPFKWFMPIVLVLWAQMIVLTSCGGASKLVSPMLTTGKVQIEISRSSKPTFSWVSTTAIEAISVTNFRPDGTIDRILWGYRGVAASPPVTYGESIIGGTSLALGAAPALQSGVRYRVEVVSAGQASTADWIVP